MNRQIVWVSVAALAVHFSQSALAAGRARPEVRLKVGHSVVLDLSKFEGVSAADPAIADVKAIGATEVLVVGLKEGNTEIKVSAKRSTYTYAVTVLGAASSDKDLTPGATTIIELKVGQSMAYPEKKLARVAVGEPEIADVRVAGTGLVILGTKPGSTTLIVWLEAGPRVVSEVRVSP